MWREPLQLVLWTPRELHLMQRGRQEAADRMVLLSLRLRTEFGPRSEPWWVRQAYKDFWEGKAGSSGPSAGEDR